MFMCRAFLIGQKAINVDVINMEGDWDSGDSDSETQIFELVLIGL